MQHSTVAIEPEKNRAEDTAASLPERPAPPEHREPVRGEPESDRLVSLLLTRFANLPPERTGLEMAAMLRDITDSFGFDACGLLALDREQGGARPVRYLKGGQEWEEPPTPGPLFPWTLQSLLDGNIVCFSSPAELPARAALDRLNYEKAGVHSYLAIPIYAGNAVRFSLVSQLGSPYPWKKETISLLRLIGEVLVIALARCREERTVDPLRRLEELIPAVSERLINLSGEELERAIPALLAEVRRLIGLDLLSLLTFFPERGELTVSHSSCGEGIAPVPEGMEVAPLFPWTRERLLRGETVRFRSLDELPAEAAVDRQSWQAAGVGAGVTLPIRVAGAPSHLLSGAWLEAGAALNEALLPPLHLLGELFAGALTRLRLELAHREARAEIQRLEEARRTEAEHLQAELVCSRQHEKIVGQSAALARTLALTEQVAPTDSTVLIYGETGTGKELVAQAIHKLGQRRNRPMVMVNCASLPAALVESELFGREKGAYTGALTRQAGRFELADRGTIFLDEIAEMSLELQVKLLRVLQEGQFERLGSGKTIQVDVRVIAATNRNLAEEVKKGNFREDLYYRLNVFPIVVPPLRERSEDIPLLVWSFVHEFGEKMGKKINKVSRQDMAALQRYPWPGNVRELRNVVEHAVIVSSGDTLQVRLPESGGGELSGLHTLEQYETMHILDALRLTGWRIKGEGGAARLLGINPSTLYSRMQKLGIANRPAKDEMSP